MRRTTLSAHGSRATAPPTTGPRPVRPPADDIDMRLIGPVQVYLELRRMGVTPGPTLERAWAAFFGAANPVVLAAARAGRGTRADLADGIQEAWREIITCLPAYRHDPARGLLRDWLFVLARRAWTRMRRGGGHRPLMPLPPGAVDDIEGRPSDPSAMIERAERREQVGRRLLAFRDQAGPVEFWVVLLHWVGGGTTAQVAARLGLTDGQVRGHLARARPKLRAALGAVTRPGCP